MQMSKKASWNYAEERLLTVSRTFALNINILSGKLHHSVLLAYLYLRIADTIEDDAVMKAAEKEKILGLFADIFKSSELSDKKIEAFKNALPSYFAKDSEKDANFDLCLKADVVVPLLKSLPEKYAFPVRNVVVEMCGGMAKFCLRQEAALTNGWFTLDKVKNLDEYCYYVAGIVGKLLTQVFSADSLFINDKRKAQLQKLDVSFGLALQVTNIVKDVIEDSTRHVCFIPEEICKRHGFEHSYELFGYNPDKTFESRRAAVLAELVQKAWKHLDDAIEYTKLIPNITMRTRLFCLWPLFMAAENLKLIGNGEVVFASQNKAKISRDTVKKIIASTMRHFYSNSWIDKTYKGLKNESC